MTHLEKQQNLVRKIYIARIILTVVEILYIIISFVVLMDDSGELLYSTARFRSIIGLIILLYAIPDMMIKKICTCKRCGYKMSRKEFLAKTDLVCPNGENHNIL